MLEGLLEGFHQAAPHAGAELNPVLDDRNRLVGDRGGLGRLEIDQALGPERSHVSRGEEAGPHLGPGKVRRSRDREGHERTRVRVRGQQVVRRALRRIACDDAVAVPAVRDPHLGEQQLQMVVQLGHRPDARARRLHRPALINRHRRQDPLDTLDARLVHAVEELARVGGEALDVPPLPFGVEDVEGKARFPRAGDARDDGHGVERHADVDTLQVVLASADDDDGGRVHAVRSPRGTREPPSIPAAHFRERVPRVRA